MKRRRKKSSNTFKGNVLLFCESTLEGGSEGRRDGWLDNEVEGVREGVRAVVPMQDVSSLLRPFTH